MNKVYKKLCLYVFVFATFAGNNLTSCQIATRCFQCQGKGCDGSNTTVQSCDYPKIQGVVARTACLTVTHSGGEKEKACVNLSDGKEIIKKCNNSLKCDFCETSLCNSGGIQGLTCFFCKKCPSNLEKIDVSFCKKPNFQCYASVIIQNGQTEVNRNCADMDNSTGEKQKFCVSITKKGGSCRICNTHLCNLEVNDPIGNYTIRNGSAIIAQQKKEDEQMSEEPIIHRSLANRKSYSFIGLTCSLLLCIVKKHYTE